MSSKRDWSLFYFTLCTVQFMTYMPFYFYVMFLTFHALLIFLNFFVTCSSFFCVFFILLRIERQWQNELVRDRERDVVPIWKGKHENDTVFLWAYKLENERLLCLTETQTYNATTLRIQNKTAFFVFTFVENDCMKFGDRQECFKHNFTTFHWIESYAVMFIWELHWKLTSRPSILNVTNMISRFKTEISAWYNAL